MLYGLIDLTLINEKKQKLRLVSTCLRKQAFEKHGMNAPKMMAEYFKSWVAEQEYVIIESTEKGKFGRILGRIYNSDMSVCYNDKSIEDHHAVVYNGENKALVEEQHMQNRIWLTEQGMVV